ncbi:MAG: toxin-antitoxin system YwqK family antitoxin [Bacteroidales bacterium]
MPKPVLILMLLFCSGLSAFAQNIDLKDGYHVFNYPNGAISSEGTIRDGKPDGYWKSYYVTGVLKSEGNRRNFLLDSVWVFYTQTGDTLEKIDYVLGRKSGYYIKYKRDNVFGLYIWSRELYAGDRREGIGRQYFPDGGLMLTIPYSNGKKEGLSREYDRNGRIITLYEYRNDFLTARRRINRYDGDGLKQGEWVEFYPGGTVKSEVTYRNDMMHGYYKEYDSRGILTLTMLYDNGVIVEESVDDDPDIEVVNRYDNNGNLIFSGPYREGIPVGVHREYDGKGNVISSFIFNDKGVKVSEGIVDEEGNRQGEWKNLFPDGGVKETGSYSANRRSGLWRFFNEKGETVQLGSYRNGREDGRWVWYYDDGSVLREEEYFQGKRDGSFAEYARDGSLISSGSYTDGERNGPWVYTVGDHREEGSYIMGLRDGEWKYFDTEGNLLYRGKYLQGNPDGYHFYYRDNGRVAEEQYYSSGIREKTWKKYDTEGNVFMTIAYKNDIEVRINGVRINLPDSGVRLIR